MEVEAAAPKLWCIAGYDFTDGGDMAANHPTGEPSWSRTLLYPNESGPQHIVGTTEMSRVGYDLGARRLVQVDPEYGVILEQQMNQRNRLLVFNLCIQPAMQQALVKLAVYNMVMP